MGFAAVDGTLFENGTNHCIAIRIECTKKDMLCRIASARVEILYSGNRPQIWEIRIHELSVSRWSEAGIVAAGQSNVCEWEQLFIDFATEKVKIIDTTEVGVGCNKQRGRTLVFDVETPKVP
jgi:hypothetical protein